MLLKALKFLTGILLIPFCIIATAVLGHLIMSLQPDSARVIPPSFRGLAIGFFLWIFLFTFFSKPIRTYVLGHELTHALWAAISGAKVSRLKVSGKGGSVHVSKNTFLITLAPYFFPFYTACVLILYAAVSYFYDQTTYEPFWLGLVGLTWAFHLTFTVHMLFQHQPDIQEQGRLFSYVIIYLFNVAGLCLWIICASSITFQTFSGMLLEDAQMVFDASLQAINHLRTYLHY